MSRLIQSLESRTLFSATSAEAAVLLGDVRQVTASAATVRAGLRAAVSAATTGVNKVAADLRSSTTPANRAANAALLRTLRAGELGTFATLRVDQTGLTVVGAAWRRGAAAECKGAAAPSHQRGNPGAGGGRHHRTWHRAGGQIGNISVRQPERRDALT